MVSSPAHPPLNCRWPLPLGILSLALLATQAAQAQSLMGLQQAAIRCLNGTSRADCSAALGTSHQLKNRADAANELRCYTALLGLESRLSMAMQGSGSVARDHSSLKETIFECRALNPG
jgi:hypothetical protein